MNGCPGRGGRRRGSDCLAGWGFLSDENALETEEVRCDAQSVSSASEWDTWKCFTWCSFLSGEYSNKEGRAVNGLEWGLSRGKDGSELHPLGFCTRVRQCPLAPGIRSSPGPEVEWGP